MRTSSKQLRVTFLVCSAVLIPTHSVCNQKNENNPGKIGHRVVAHKSIISPENELAVGRGEAEQFEKSVQLVKDPVVERFMTTMANSVVRNSDWKGQVTVKEVGSPEVESSYLPGGFIYVTSGLLLAADNDDQVAAVIAHEVAHTAARHWASELTKMTIAQYAMVPLYLSPQSANSGAQLSPSFTPIIAGDCFGFSRRYSDVGPPMYLKFLRQDELEADYLGLQYVYKAGYDPNAYIAFLRKLLPKDAISQGLPDAFRATPPVSQRIENAEDEIRKILRNAALQPKVSPEFALVKSRL